MYDARCFLANLLLACLHCARTFRSATEALKLVGETFPWSPAPGWTPARRVTPGGASASEVGLVSACGADVDAPAGGDTASRFVYTR